MILDEYGFPLPYGQRSWHRVRQVQTFTHCFLDFGLCSSLHAQKLCIVVARLLDLQQIATPCATCILLLLRVRDPHEELAGLLVMPRIGVPLFFRGSFWTVILVTRVILSICHWPELAIRNNYLQQNRRTFISRLPDRWYCKPSAISPTGIFGKLLYKWNKILYNNRRFLGKTMSDDYHTYHVIFKSQWQWQLNN